MRKILLFLLLITIVVPTVVVGQSHKTGKGGVALVLSGGGAKGLYHVGIIRALEENDIPIDYVSGTSMGAIVASLYAAGWSPERMWDFFLTDSVSQWLTGQIPDKYKGYYRQFEPTPEMVGIDVKTDTVERKSMLRIPTNLISPYLIDVAFMDLLGPASAAAGNNFDNLFVPFRCVATDAYNSQAVTFKNGYLPFAVRSSMTIPLIFSPMVMDSLLLYDGGLKNNFPWQTIEEEFAPSNFIGGVCTDNNSNPAADDLAAQIFTLAMAKTDYNLPDSTTDTRIMRVMHQVNVLDYAAADTIMQWGYRDAMAQMDDIKRKVKTRRTKEEVQRRRAEFLHNVPSLAFDSIYIEGLSPAQERYARAQLDIEDMKYFTYEHFYAQYMMLLGAGVFTSDFPTLSYNPESGYYQIHLRLQTKSSTRFSVGGNISSTSLNQAYVAINLHNTTSMYSTYSAEGYLGFTYNAIKLSGRHDLYNKGHFYIDYSFFSEEMRYNGGNMGPYYRNKEWLMLDDEVVGVNLSITRPIFENSAFKLKSTVASSTLNYQETLHTSVDLPSRTRFRYVSLKPIIETSTINYAMYGNAGLKEQIAFGYTLGLEDFTPGTMSTTPHSVNKNRWWLEFRYNREQYLKIGDWFTLGYLVDVAVTNHKRFRTDLATSFTSPRFAPTPQMELMFMPEYTSSSYIAGGIMPTFNLSKDNKMYLKTYVYAFLPQELFFDGTQFIPMTATSFEAWSNYVFGGSLVYQTPVGPVSLSLAKYTTGRENWNFEFNFGYTLFNNQRF